MTTRKSFSNEFKTKVAMEALRGEKLWLRYRVSGSGIRNVPDLGLLEETVGFSKAKRRFRKPRVQRTVPSYSFFFKTLLIPRPLQNV